MTEPIAVDGLTIDHDTGSVISGGVFTIITPPSQKVDADGKAAYFGDLQYSFAAGDADGFTPGTVATVAPQTIPATSVKVAGDGLAVVRLGDSGTMAAQGTPEGGGPPAPVSGPVVVADAAQDKVEAD
jgi:hypothetical protein